MKSKQEKNSEIYETSRTPPYAIIVTCVLLVCFIIISLDTWRSWTARNTQVTDAQIATANLARSLAQHAHDMLSTADTLLVSLRDEIEIEGAGLIQRDHLHRLIAGQIATLPMMRDLMVFDAQGYRVINSGRPAPAIENILDREYFQFHAANVDRNVHLGSPIRGKLDGTWIITLSRRINGAAGEFEGVVVATFSIDAISHFYQTFDVGHHGFIGLNTIDGVIITRYPSNEAQIGHNISTSIVYTEKLATVPMGDWQSISPVDHINHLGSYRRVESFPLVVVVGRGVEELLTPWLTDALFHFVISLCTSAIIACLGLHFNRQLRLQHRAKRNAQRSEQQYRLLADHTNDVVIKLGPDLRGRYVSPPSTAVLGYAPHELIDEHLTDIAHPDDRPAAVSCLEAIAADGNAPPFVFRIRHKNGRYIWAEGVGRRLPKGEGIVMSIRDVSTRKEAEILLLKANKQLEEIAMRDGLTGIANRRCFDVMLEREFRRAVRTEGQLALLMIDVDYFKSFNDLNGHQAGDGCLTAIAEVTDQQMRRPADQAARYGGEEFAALLPDTDKAGAIVLGERVRRAVTLLSVPHPGAPKGIVSVSIGVAVICPRHDGQTAEDLILQADRALYQAKSKGRDRIYFSTGSEVRLIAANQ